jgi:hypothetical protein
MLALLPDQFKERAGKMVEKCRHISEYIATPLRLNTGLYKTEVLFFLHMLLKMLRTNSQIFQPINVKLWTLKFIYSIFWEVN